MLRVGVTVPLDGVALADLRPVVTRLAEAGYSEVSTGEVNGVDGLTPLAAVAGCSPGLHLVCAVANVFTRGPALLAMSACALGELAPGRAYFGIGAGSAVIVEKWNGLRFVNPHDRVADTLRFLRQALAGESPAGPFQTLSVSGFRLSRLPEVPPRLLVAGQGPKMLRLVAEEADAGIVNWLTAEDVRTVAGYLAEASDPRGGSTELLVRVFVVADRDTGRADTVARRAIAQYLNVPGYRRFHEWLGHAAELQGLWDRWGGGDRRGALDAIPDGLARDLVIRGTPEECAERVLAYGRAGASGVTLRLLRDGGAAAEPDRDLDFLSEVGRLVSQAVA